MAPPSISGRNAAGGSTLLQAGTCPDGADLCTLRMRASPPPAPSATVARHPMAFTDLFIHRPVLALVDDAIVVVENVERHLSEGQKPFAAALLGARELVGPIIAMTITLAAVYAPIGLQGGLTGALFREFAFTLAGAVTISGIVALTLSPMMSAKLLKPGIEEHGLADAAILHKAHAEAHILITNDQDFREWTFRDGSPHRVGVAVHTGGHPCRGTACRAPAEGSATRALYLPRSGPHRRLRNPRHGGQSLPYGSNPVREAGSANVEGRCH